MNRSRIYILPGWGDRLTDRAYVRIAKMAKTRGYEHIPIKFPTRSRKYALGSARSLSEIVESIETQISKPSERDVVLGFSIGATLAYLLATRLRFRKVILCSLSAVLGADLATYTRSDLERVFTKSQILEMRRLKYGKLNCKSASVLYGELEPRVLRRRSQVIGRRSGHTCTEVAGAEHELESDYLVAIEHAL